MKNKPKLKVGDYITAYEKGYHKVVSLQDGGGSGLLVLYYRVLDSNGKKVKSNGIKRCDSSWVKKLDKTLVSDTLKGQENIFKELASNLNELLKLNQLNRG